MKQINSYRQEALHATIHMNAIQAQLFAAIGAAFETRMTCTAVDIRIDGAQIADLQPQVVYRDIDNFARKLMAEDPRIGVNRVAAGKGMKVTATDPDSFHANQCFTGRSGRNFNLTFD